MQNKVRILTSPSASTLQTEINSELGVSLNGSTTLSDIKFTQVYVPNSPNVIGGNPKSVFSALIIYNIN